MKVVVWNMQQKVSNWHLLASWPELRDADIYLLCEAPPAPPDVQSVGVGYTEGLEVALGPKQPVKRPWSTAISSRHPLSVIQDARKDRYYRARLPYEPSRAGTWLAASISVNGTPISAISLYGLMDERSDASVHRSLSELSPIFDHRAYRTNLILGGDLNILANPRASDPARRRHLAVLSRLEAYGLVDCLEKVLRERKPARGPLTGCPCGLGDGCLHTETKRVKGSSIPYQDDYLYVSRGLARYLRRCVALPLTAGSPSDHAPLVATFDLPGEQIGRPPK